MLISEFSKISGIESGCLIFVIDENIWNIYQTELKERMGLLEKEKRILMWICPAGESTKNFDEYQKCLEYLLKNNVHRSSHLIAIGGGATSDFAGFVASTILRGIPWSVIPTTLLAMVDASIGGKTAINSSFGKNLIGTFHKPENIWLNSKFLKTLNNDEIQSGKGEILKYALLDKDLFEVIQTNPDDLAQIIYQCAEYKSQIVANDYLEQGGRKVLNLGHTIGHALEKIYQIPHGVAVVWGIFLQDQLFNQSVLLKEIESIVSKLGLSDLIPPWESSEWKAKEIFEFISRDKKIIREGVIEFILVKEIGTPLIAESSLENIWKIINEFGK